MKSVNYVLVTVAGLIIGIFIGRQYFSKCNSDDDTTRPNFATIQEDVAHKMSENYRMVKGYCNNPDEHQTDGYFVLMPTNFDDLLNSKLAIEKQCRNTGVAIPTLYRCIFGLDDNNTEHSKMIVVGLDANGNEIASNGMIQLLNDKLPCPVLCDQPLSQIIFGQDGLGGCR
jgi:hypothetical protein